MLGGVPAGCIGAVESRKGKGGFHMMRRRKYHPGIV